VADTSPGGALLFFPSCSATGGANTRHTRACTVAGDDMLDYLVVLPLPTSYCMF